MRFLTALLVLAGLLVPATSDAFLVQDFAGPQSGTNGIALGPDGNFWVAEQFSGSVIRISPGGNIIARYLVGTEPHAVVTGPGDRVWVAVNGGAQLTWFDAKSTTPTAHPVALPSSCMPDAVAAANARMYFSCSNASKLGYVKDDGTGAPTTAAAGGGTVYDLEALDGKLFAPDYNNNVVRRLGADLDVESTITMPTMSSGPNGITSDGLSTLWVTENGVGKIARFTAGQTDGLATEFTPTGGVLEDPSGIVVGSDKRIYVAGKGSHNVVRLNADGTDFRFYPVAGDAQPLNIVNGPDGDLVFTDQNKPLVRRLVNSAPRVTTGSASGDGASATVDPRGNETQVVFDYGRTTDYGMTTTPKVAPSGVAPVTVSAALPGLAAGSTYHVRARATNGEGETAAADTTFDTPGDVVVPTPTPVASRLKAKTTVKVKARKRTVIRKIVISGLIGTETATIRCAGKSCPFKKKAFTLEAGKRTFGRSLFKGRKLKPGVKITVAITAPGRIGTKSVVTVRKNKKPKVKRT